MRDFYFDFEEIFDRAFGDWFEKKQMLLGNAGQDEKEEDVELLKCPQCGKKVPVLSHYLSKEGGKVKEDYYKYTCGNCGKEGTRGSSIKEASELWNAESSIAENVTEEKTMKTYIANDKPRSLTSEEITVLAKNINEKYLSSASIDVNKEQTRLILLYLSYLGLLNNEEVLKSIK